MTGRFRGSTAEKRKEGGIGARVQVCSRVGDWGHANASTVELDLAARLQAGDPAALNALAEAYGPRLYRYLIRLAPDAETARDLTQECLLRAVRSLQAGVRPDRLLPWLYRIATNLARDDHRSAYRQRVLLCDEWDLAAEPTSTDPAQAVLDGLWAASRREAVDRALQRLPVELREVILLRFTEEQPIKAIAAIVGVPEGTVKSRLYRAYRLLEQELRAWNPGTGGPHRNLDGSAHECPGAAGVFQDPCEKPPEGSSADG